MKRKGVSYVVGRVMGFNWRPHFDPKIVDQELEIIAKDLHFNAVRICGRSIDRLMIAAEDAVQKGLEVWLSPLLWDKNPEKTLKNITKAATAAKEIASEIRNGKHASWLKISPFWRMRALRGLSYPNSSRKSLLTAIIPDSTLTWQAPAS